jgi:hypothetical protein
MTPMSECAQHAEGAETVLMGQEQGAFSLCIAGLPVVCLTTLQNDKISAKVRHVDWPVH